MSDVERDLFERLPAVRQMALRHDLWMYLGRKGIPAYEDMLTILWWKQLEGDVLEAHADWLQRTKTAVEALGRPWTVEEMNHYVETIERNYDE